MAWCEHRSAPPLAVGVSATQTRLGRADAPHGQTHLAPVNVLLTGNVSALGPSCSRYLIQLSEV